MDPDRAWQVIDEERGRIADLLEDLHETEWAAGSLCTQWSVRDVAAHLTLAHTGLFSLLGSVVRARGDFDRTIRDTAVRQARLPVTEYPRRLRAMVGSRRTAPFLTEIHPLIDVLCHAQDIARPLGRTHPMPADAAAAAADHIWTTSFPFFARRRLRGVELVATDAPWRVGAGERIEGPAGALLLLVSGRPAALADLTGPGLEALSPTVKEES